MNAEPYWEAKLKAVATGLMRRAMYAFNGGVAATYARAVKDVMAGMGYEHREGEGWVRREPPG